MESMFTTIPTEDPQESASAYIFDPRANLFFLATSIAALFCGIALLVWYLRRGYYLRTANVQQASIPMNPLTRPPPPYDLESNLRMETIHEESPNTSSGMNATPYSSLKTAKATENAEVLFGMEKERMKKITGRDQLTDLEVRACKGKALGTINSKKNQEKIDRRSRMSQKTRDEIEEKEELKADAVNIMGQNPFADIHEVKDVDAQGYDEETRLGKANEGSNVN